MADAPVSIREVAALAGVSVGTVSNVLNRPGVVAEPTRSRVQQAIKSLGFIRNESARQLRAGRSRIIGLVVLDVANPFFPILHRCRARGRARHDAARPVADPVQQRQQHRPAAALPVAVPGAAVLRRPAYPGGPGPGPHQRAAQERRPRRACRPCGRQPAVLGVRRRRGRGAAGRVAPARARSPADRLRRRRARGAPGGRPAGRRPAGDGRGGPPGERPDRGGQDGDDHRRWPRGGPNDPGYPAAAPGRPLWCVRTT